MTIERRIDAGASARSTESTVTGATPAGEDTPARGEGQALLDAADEAIDRALSRDSSRFLAQSRQAGRQ